MTITTIKRPKFYEFFGQTPDTERVCSREGCNAPALFVGGHYNVETRRVRVWVCEDHQVGNPNKELPVPASVQYALRKEAEYIEQQRQRARFIEPTERSIITLAPSGHGEPLSGDRVKAWRWGE